MKSWILTIVLGFNAMREPRQSTGRPHSMHTSISTQTSFPILASLRLHLHRERHHRISPRTPLHSAYVMHQGIYHAPSDPYIDWCGFGQYTTRKELWSSPHRAFGLVCERLDCFRQIPGRHTTRKSDYAGYMTVLTLV